MSKEIHKTKESRFGHGIRRIIYAGYITMSCHQIRCNVKEGSKVRVAYLWKDVTCALCLKESP